MKASMADAAKKKPIPTGAKKKLATKSPIYKKKPMMGGQANNA